MRSFRKIGFRRLSCTVLISALHLQGMLFYLLCAALTSDFTEGLPFADADRCTVAAHHPADHQEMEFPETPSDTPQPISEEERAESEKSDAPYSPLTQHPFSVPKMRDVAYDMFAHPLSYCAIITPPPEVI